MVFKLLKLSFMMNLILISSCKSFNLSKSKDYTPYFSVPLDPNDNLHLFWKVYYDSENIEFELRANLVENQWLAIGFSDYGEIANADVCIYWMDERGNYHFEDGWTDEASYVTIEDKNDCRLMNKKLGKGPNGSGEFHILFSRKFDTCDPNDYVIEDGTTHVIYAMGHGRRRVADGLRLSNTKHGFTRVQLLKPVFAQPNVPEDVKNLKFLNKKVKIQNVETTYWCSTHKLPSMHIKNHLIRFGAQIQKGNEPLVHHMELFHCEVERDVEIPQWNGPCPKKPKDLESCKRVIAAWAMGAEDLIYPDEAGEPIGGENYNPYLMLEVHYNNPELKDNWVDSSGISFYYTPQLRKFDAGVIELGLEYTDKMAIPPGQDSFRLDSYCVAECTRVGLEKDGINIFASQLHTHLTGIKVATKHVRGGKELPELNRDNHYSTHFQEIRRLKKMVKVFPGDALVTSCTFQTSDRQNVTLGGFAISDEMCVNYIHYYPKIDLEVCKSSVDSENLNRFFKYMNSYSGQNTSAKKGINDNYHSIQWSALNADILHEFYQTAPLSMQCNQSNGQRFPGLWEGVPSTNIRIPLTEEEKCQDKI